MGGLLGGPKMPPMPKIKPPKMPETPRMPVETDPDIERRAKIRRNAERTGRRSTLLSENTRQTSKASLGGSSGRDYPGLTKG
jgi:hypothetical protein